MLLVGDALACSRPGSVDIACALLDEASPLSDRSCVHTPESQVAKRRRAADAADAADYSPDVPSSPILDDELVKWLSAVYQQLGSGLEQLYRLHKACTLIPEETTQLALAVFRQYAAAAQLCVDSAALEPFVFRGLLATCLWVSIKFLATPGVVPDANWMGAIFSVPSKLLVAWEPKVLQGVDFKLYRLCKAIGLESDDTQ